eukprot:Em0009g828a
MIVTVDRSAEEAATLLPSLEDVFQLSTPTLHHIPANALPAFASVLSQALRSVIHDNTMEAWIKLLLLPKCCLPSTKRKGRHHKPIDIKMLCDLWSRGQFVVLWRLAICHSKVGSATKSCNKSLRPRHDYAISLAQDGLYSKACQVLTSSGIAPNTPETWKLLESKHPQGPIPTHPKSFDLPVNIPHDLDIMAILRSFPKLTAAGPSGMRVQHLLDAATVPLPTSIMSSLRHVANLLAAGKAPKELSIYLSGATLTALSKNKSNCPPDVRPIAVGEVLRRLTSKCMCHLIKHKAAEFFHPFQFGVACPRGAEKILHSLMCCFDDHWADNNFVVLKVDMTNAFNLVSRQAVLDECAQHFPELLAWASWCYGQHSILWHSLGTLTSQNGVQQGDPLGPFMFALVLQKMVTTIHTDEACAGLLQMAWYLDDGSIAGESSSVLRALTIIQAQGPSLGFFVNLKKCEI